MATAGSVENYEMQPCGYPIECLKEETRQQINRQGLICVLCRNILRSAVQVSCGARYCEECYKALFRDVSDGLTSCPSCELEGTENTIHLAPSHYQPDTFCRKQVKLLEARCQYATRGCPWVGKLIYSEEHMLICPFPNNSVNDLSGADDDKKTCSSCGHGDVSSGNHIEQICVRFSELDCKTTNSLQTAPVNGHQYQHMPNSFLINDISQVETVRQRVTDLEKVVKELQGVIPTMERLLQEAQANKKGRLTWCIENMSQKLKDAETGAVLALYSPPFFSDDAGYKMCARLCLNGDGVGKGSHVSLFFVIMKGPYDPILPWPFTCRVTLQLLDQSGHGNHVQEKFKADPNSCCFNQPQDEMNIEMGFPRFISKSELERCKDFFMKDDVMFIRVIVE